MQKTVRRTLAAAAMTGVALLGTGAPAIAGEIDASAPAPGLPAVPGLSGLPDLAGLTTLVGPAAETGKLTDIAPGGVPVPGLVDSALKAPEQLGLPKLPQVPGLGS